MTSDGLPRKLKQYGAIIGNNPPLALCWALDFDDARATFTKSFIPWKGDLEKRDSWVKAGSRVVRWQPDMFQDLLNQTQ